MSDSLAALVRAVPDFPEPGVTFRDLTPLIADPAGLRATVSALATAAPTPFDCVAGIEARGFLFAAPLAHALGSGLILLRKPGKLPAATIGHDYALEYGSDRLEMHADALAPGARVLLVDDVLATGGTAEAAVRLIRRGGGEVAGALFVAEIAALGGAERLRAAGVAPHSLLSY
ncbi:MAG: adenine phosphoribosyltransferase [Thermaurantiacus sp.]